MPKAKYIAEKEDPRELLAYLLEKLPPVIVRERISEETGGLIGDRELSNLQGKGKMPDFTYKCGGRVFYITKDVLPWWFDEKGLVRLRSGCLNPVSSPRRSGILSIAGLAKGTPGTLSGLDA